MLNILCTAEFDDDYIKELSKFANVKQRGFSVNQDFREMLTKEELINELQGMDIFIVGYDKVTDEVLKSNPDLKLVLSVRDGPEENIDVETCKKLGIPVLFSAGRCIRSVSEQTMLLILSMARPIFAAHNALYDGTWSQETLQSNPNRYYDFFKIIDNSHEIYGKTLGLVGAGRNGLGIAERAQAFGMRVIAYDPYANKEQLLQKDIELVDLMEVMSSSDYVVVMARVTPETIGLIGEEQLYAMKQDSCLINTARAALVDSSALLKILQEGKIRAAFEVWDQEPISQDNPFLKLDPSRALLLPHFAGCSVERIIFHSKAATENIMDFLKGKKTTHIYSSAVFDSPLFSEHGGKLFGIME